MRAIELDLSICAEDEHAIVAQMPQQVVKKRQRALVGPVHIVDEHQETAFRRKHAKESRDVVEQAQALLVRRQRRISGERAKLGLDFRRELGDFSRGRPERGASCRPDTPR